MEKETKNSQFGFIIQVEANAYREIERLFKKKLFLSKSIMMIFIRTFLPSIFAGIATIFIAMKIGNEKSLVFYSLLSFGIIIATIMWILECIFDRWILIHLNEYLWSYGIELNWDEAFNVKFFRRKIRLEILNKKLYWKTYELIASDV